MNIERLLELSERLSSGEATQEELDEAIDFIVPALDALMSYALMIYDRMKPIREEPIRFEARDITQAKAKSKTLMYDHCDRLVNGPDVEEWDRDEGFTQHAYIRWGSDGLDPKGKRRLRGVVHRPVKARAAFGAQRDVKQSPRFTVTLEEYP